MNDSKKVVTFSNTISASNRPSRQRKSINSQTAHRQHDSVGPQTSINELEMKKLAESQSLSKLNKDKRIVHQRSKSGVDKYI